VESSVDPSISSSVADGGREPSGSGDRAPNVLGIGPVDSPRFAVPPFAPDYALPSQDDGTDVSPSSPDASEESPSSDEARASFDSEGTTTSPPDVGGDGSPAIEDGMADEELEIGASNGSDEDENGVADDVPDLDALMEHIDEDQIDETVSRMATSRSLAPDVSDRVVEMLLRRQDVDDDAVRLAKTERDRNHPDSALWRVLAEQDGVDRSKVYERAARIYAFEVVDLEEHAPDRDFIRSTVESFSEDLQERLLDLGVVPLRGMRTDGTNASERLCFITHDPMRPEVHRVVRRLGVSKFDLRYAPKSDVDQLLTEVFSPDNEYLERLDEESALDLGQNFEEEEDLVDQEKLEEEINRSTLINLFEATLVEAVREGASDIHLYPNANKEVEIHFRNDGRLNHWHTEDRVHPEALLSVVKDNSMNVDRFESDAAQDGFIQRDVDGTRIRFRVSIMPIASASQDIDAESVVIRVLDDRKVIKDLNKLGLGSRALDRFEHAINQPYGMVILTGPTGSGKSTTLVAALHRVIGPGENVLTIEDPVEYIIEGARQIKLSDKLHLEDALRSVLRHDPDTVMVGEMRDKITAELAIKLANTGHLTFSTLHTNDAPSAVSRLYKMGIEPFLIAYAINLVVAQRLIRTLCPNCKQEDSDPDPLLLKQLGFSEEEIEHTTFYVANEDSGCGNCSGTGYDGRRAIAEALHFSQEIRHMIVEAEGMVDEGDIRRHARDEDGMRSLQASARRVVSNGNTSVQEMMRVVAS